METLDLDFLNDDFEIEAETRFEPVPFDLKISKKEIATVDTETDPFAPSYLIKPFAVGFRTADRYIDFWGDDCVEQFFDYLECESKEGREYIIYAHNGGKFDFFYFLQFLTPNKATRIINGRLVSIYFRDQEFRDSYAIIPVGLAAYQKDKIDYQKFTKERRETHKVEIRHYLQKDCDYLYDLVTAFHRDFGDRLTVASVSLLQLNSFHGFERIHSEKRDAQFREYYYGGRNQCFETGIVKARPGKQFILVDRNSMYPAVMRDELHPISATYDLNDRITDKTDFACIVAENRGALPVRASNGGLDFTVPYGIFFATIHEIRAGIETGTLKIDHVKHAWEFEKKASFPDFINHFYTARKAAQAKGDKIEDLFTKLIMNASYGKFALNPRKFKDWIMTIREIPEPLASEENPNGWSLHTSSGDIYIWERPSPRKGGFYNVATAASITGAARANLLRNLSLSERPIYCDTDSIICERFSGDLSETELGGWKIEATGNLAAIAGKKLYALFNNETPLKKASKGCILSAEEIVSLCNGNEIVYQNPAPSFHLHDKGSHQLGEGIGSASFITRKIKMTG